MPSTLNIPARTEHRCSPCEFHKLVGAFHARSGNGSWREYICTHPQSERRPEDKKYRELCEALESQHSGRWIGKTEKQPDWCPLRREVKE